MPDFEAKLRFLKTPESYGESNRNLECIETHMSWVFLTGDRVFKLKKPVCLPLLDFTTVKAREFFCREEVRLNVCLAPGVYLGVLAMQWFEGDFSLLTEAQLPAPGGTVDWLVLMRRLPSYRMLTHMMESHNVFPDDIDALVNLLSDFYRDAPVVPVAASDYVNRFKEKQVSNRGLLLRPKFKLKDAALAIERLDVALLQGDALLGARALCHRVLDGHGDLRPDHVCLLHPPVVFDCLEFSPQLRQVDPFDEISFLGLECDMAGAPWIGAKLTARVAEALCDHPPAALMHFYAAHHALLRARLAVSHLLDPDPRTPEKWLPLAQRYIARALVAIDCFNATRQRDTIE